MIDHKIIVVLITLLANQNLSLYELSVKTRFSIKDVRDCIDQLTIYLSNREIKIEQDKGRYYVTGILDRKNITTLIGSEELQLPKRIRLHLIYLYTFCRTDFVSNWHYQDFLKVSKNTTLSDIRSLRKNLQTHHLDIEYSRSQGYIILGDEKQKHLMAFKVVNELLNSPVGLWGLEYVISAWPHGITFEILNKLVQDYSKILHLTPISDKLQECLYGITLILCRYQRKVSRVVSEEIEVPSQIRNLADILLDNAYDLGGFDSNFTRSDRQYIAGLLSSGFEGNTSVDFSYFKTLTDQIVEKMESISLLQFSQQVTLKENLIKHLIPVYYRLKFGLPSSNDYTDRIKEQNPDLFEFVKESLEPLSKVVGLSIPDSEIAYFVVHFGGYLKKNETSTRKNYRAVIVCPNGTSSSLMIKENLRILFPQVSFIGVTRVDRLHEFKDDEFDLVFSTVKVETQKPQYLVSVMMSVEQSSQLVQLVSKDFPEMDPKDIELERLLELIKRFASVSQESELRIALKNFIYEEMQRKEVLPLLQDLITEKMFQRSSEKMGWKDAIRKASQPMLESGQITANYPEAMIGKVEEFGPFINLGKGIAIPHARPEDGVNEVGMSMLVLDHPIYLLDDPAQEIRLLICIAAVDNQTHLKALKHLTMILRDNAKVERLLTAQEFNDIKEIIQQED
jgi:bglG family transcriptional regulator